MTKLCICQMCTCGHHKCPHRPWGIIGKGDQPCAVTEYKNEFRGHDIEKRKPFKPDNEYKNTGVPLADETTHKHDYIKHNVDKVRLRSPDRYRQPEGEMDTMTSYNKEFVPKQGERAQPIRHDGAKKVSAQFEGNPTYKADYRRWELSKTDAIRHDPGWSQPTEPFAGDSTYVKDFIKHSQAPRNAIRPDQAPVNSGEPFDDRTGYRQDYIKHAMPDKFVRPRDEYQLNKVPLENMTTNRRDFTPKDIEKMKSYKPDGTGYRSDAPFDDGTTHKIDYKKWDYKPVHVRKDDTYKGPQGEMDLSTNYNREFTAKPQQRTHQVRPASRAKIDAKFVGDTTYGQDFRKWPGDRAQPAKAGGEYQLPTVPFEGMSTYKGHYIPHSAGVTHSFKPDGTGYRSDAPFDGNTLYRMEYTPKEIAPCPAALLETHRSNYVFREADEKGHKFYQPSHEAKAQQIELTA